MSNEKANVFSVLKLGGAICAYLIGSGFASGQELLQYYASYGIMGIGAASIACLVMVYALVHFLQLGKRENIENPHQVFKYYCGDKIGSVFEFIAFTYLIVQVVVFFTGSGATIAEAFGVSSFVGSVIMGIAVILTVLLGLNRLVDIIGSLGVVLIITVLSMVTIFFFKNPTGVMAGSNMVKTMDILQPSKSWALSGFLYMTFNLLGLAAFMPLVGNKSKTQKDNVFGGILGSVAFTGTIALVTISFLTDIGNIGTKLVPNLYIAQQIHPVLSSFFSIIILLGVYTGCSPMFWNFCSRIVPEDSSKFKPFVVILGVAGVALGGVLPFDRAINIVYLVYGYVGTAFLGFVVYKEFTERKKRVAE